MTLGKKISELRKVNNYSQEDLSKLLNVSRQTISKWETDMSLPDIERIKELSHIFQVSVNELLGTDEEEKVDVNELKGIFNQLLIINKNYEKESVMLKKRQRDIVFISVITIIILCLVIGLLFFKMNETDKKIDNLSSTVNNTISSEFNGLQSSITDAIKDANAIISDFRYQIDEVNLKDMTMKMLLSVSFKKANDSDKVSFVISDNTNRNYMLEAKFNNGYFEYYGDIPLIDIDKIDVRVQDDYQTRLQSIRANINGNDIIVKSQSVDVSYIMEDIDFYGRRAYSLKEIVIQDNIENDMKNIQSSINYLRNFNQINDNIDIKIVDREDYIKIDKIDYKLYYKNELIKQGTCFNDNKSEQFHFIVPVNQRLSNYSVSKVELIVYDVNGHTHHLFEECKVSLTGFLGFRTIEEKLTLDES